MAHRKARMVSQALWLKWAHHLLADSTQRGQNGEPGLVVEMSTPLTSWWHTKRPEWWARPCGLNEHTTYRLMAHKEARMVSQALWLKWTHHLHADGTQRGQNGEPGLVVEMSTSLTYWWHTKRPEWWARPCGLNEHTTYILMAHKQAIMVSQAWCFKYPHSLSAHRS